MSIVLLASNCDKSLAKIMSLVAQNVYQWGSESFGSQDIDTSTDNLEEVKYVQISVPRNIINSLSKVLSKTGTNLNDLYVDMMKDQTKD